MLIKNIWMLDYQEHEELLNMRLVYYILVDIHPVWSRKYESQLSPLLSLLGYESCLYSSHQYKHLHIHQQHHSLRFASIAALIISQL